MDTSAPAHTDVGPLPVLSGLTIVEPIQVGHVWTAYLARQENLHREVVLTVVHSPDEDRAALAAFRNEARAASRLQHPAIAAVYAAGRTEDGRPFMVTEVLPEGSLEDRLAFGEHIAPEAVRDLGVVLSAALLAAHREGIVHGGVDASHVRFSASGSPKLTGFGLSSLRAFDDAATPRDQGPSGDVAALAATLLHALQGTVRSPRPPSPLATRLVHLLHGCTERDVERRPSMETLHAELLALQRPDPAVPERTAVSAGSPVRVLKQRTEREATRHVETPPRRRRLRLVLAASLALFAAGTVGVGSYAVVRGVLERSDAPRTTAPAALEAPASTTVASTAAPVTTVPEATGTGASAPSTAPAAAVAPSVPAGAVLEGPDEFVRRYYEIVNAEDYSQGWDLLSEEFRAARAQTYDGYVRYWQRYDVELGEVRVESLDDGVARVHIAMHYVTADQRIAEQDELTVRERDGRWEIVRQSIVG